jgi:hypothetical protein
MLCLWKRRIAWKGGSRRARRCTELCFAQARTPAIPVAEKNKHEGLHKPSEIGRCSCSILSLILINSPVLQVMLVQCSSTCFSGERTFRSREFLLTETSHFPPLLKGGTKLSNCCYTVVTRLSHLCDITLALLLCSLLLCSFVQVSPCLCCPFTPR